LTARAALWTVTDGRAGIEAQALGLAEAIARRTPVEIVRKRIKIGLPYRALPRAVWGDPFAALDGEGDTISPPWPDLWIGCGRLSVPFSMAVKARAPETFVVQIQNPRAPLGAFDVVVAPIHDRLNGANVFSILGSPNRIDAATLPRPIAPGLAPVAVLIGGPNKAFRFDERDAAALGARLVALAIPLDVTVSRRTPPAAAQALREKLGAFAARFYDPARDAESANPYPGMLGTARAVIVTEDSVNMAAEAAATGRPVYVTRLPRKTFAAARKFDDFHVGLRERGAARVFDGAIEAFAYAPLDETARAAEEILRRWRR
jgi:mitochondrial fission protein ELM1